MHHETDKNSDGNPAHILGISIWNATYDNNSDAKPELIHGKIAIYLVWDNNSDGNKDFKGIGILGAVMGLIQVMGNLSDPSKLGSGIAVAFVATIYGVGAANLLFLPIANKLKNIVHRQALMREMIVEGMASIAEGVWLATLAAGGGAERH